MIEWLVFIFLIMGAAFVLVSAIGLLRLPDLFIRIHASTKTTSLGFMLMLAGMMLTFPEWAVILKGILTILFVFLTAPLGSHMISKAGNILGIRKWDYYTHDDLNSL